MRFILLTSLVTTVLLSVIAPGRVAAQAFNSGSTGADGAFAPSTSVRLEIPADGVFNFTTMTVAAGVTVSFVTRAGVRQPPISLLATGSVTINGRIDVSGADGGPGGNGTQLFSNAGAAGPGGFDGGTGSNGLISPFGGAGLGPGGGAPGGAGLAGHAGHLTAGPGSAGGRAYGSESLVPLLGGSGGGGAATQFFGATGSGGGGGGGAVLIAASGTLTLNGQVTARGGAGGPDLAGSPGGGSGSGGAVRLVATTIAGSGGIDVVGGPGASAGRVRIEAFTNTATLSSSTAGSVTVGMPGIVTLPVVGLRIAGVAGVLAPAQPGGSYGTPDVILPAGTTSPVTVALEAQQIPLGTTITVTATPLSGAPISAISTPLIGTPAAATATATLSIPTTQPSIISATASFLLSGAP
jgi:hypothetical protein